MVIYEEFLCHLFFEIFIKIYKIDYINKYIEILISNY